MRKVLQFLSETPWPIFFGLIFGAVVGAFFGISTAHGINAQLERDEAIQQQCIDGNNNACRVMELRS
ncbi:hypothetical protein ABQZ69_19140 [Xanthomonas sp. WHRI 8391]|uniref:hypothetical protein n=1 Tax=Xanthomonas TaxID=338 RepID=UPI001A2B7C1B|nr:hypothetical protein [Xanthomonas hortorum]MBG3850383.1 hypothetical protein [Xanthomonas hortorum pv. carotae]UTS72250.1 hypothetical protein NMB96_17410 [Xanthomonas hortorum]